MKKDKEWLKEKLNTEKYYRETSELKAKTTFGELYDRGVRDGINAALEFVNQLDEPQKPVIPRFVADYYNDYKHHELTFEEWFECPEFGKGGKIENKTFEWLLDNSHEVNIERQFILADIIAHGLKGYEVEREKKYFIKEPVTGQFLIRDDSQSRGVKWVDGFSTSPSYFTEKEIKAIDERYWVFAEEATE